LLLDPGQAGDIERAAKTGELHGQGKENTFNAGDGGPDIRARYQYMLDIVGKKTGGKQLFNGSRFLDVPMPETDEQRSELDIEKKRPEYKAESFVHLEINPPVLTREVPPDALRRPVLRGPAR